jgi:hypothetical protein
MGANNMRQLTSQNIVAVADVDFDYVARSFVTATGATKPTMVPLRAAYDRATHYSDYRQMFDRQRDIDAVLIATPDHHHAVAAKMAMERGMHVYVQKPLTYTVREGRVLRDLAASKPKLVTQMGNQGHSSDDGRRVVELIRGQAIGRVREVHAWTNRPVDDQIACAEQSPRGTVDGAQPAVFECDQGRRRQVKIGVQTAPFLFSSRRGRDWWRRYRRALTSIDQVEYGDPDRDHRREERGGVQTACGRNRTTGTGRSYYQRAYDRARPVRGHSVPFGDRAPRGSVRAVRRRG